MFCLQRVCSAVEALFINPPHSQHMAFNKAEAVLIALYENHMLHRVLSQNSPIRSALRLFLKSPLCSDWSTIFFFCSFSKFSCMRVANRRETKKKRGLIAIQYAMSYHISVQRALKIIAQ